MAEPTIKQVETVHYLWQVFGWSQATEKKLPDEDLGDRWCVVKGIRWFRMEYYGS